MNSISFSEVFKWNYNDKDLSIINLLNFTSFQHIQNKVPTTSFEKQNSTKIVTSFNLTSHELISTNDSYLLKANEAQQLKENGAESTGSDYWPTWVKNVTCISHLSITVNSSVNFFIYYIKRKALNSGKQFSYYLQ